MSTGNHELGAFDRSYHQASANQIVSAAQVVLATTAQHWLALETN